MVAAVEQTINVQEGDRVRGRDLNGNSIEGIITSLGIKYAVLNGDNKTSVYLESIEVLEPASEVKAVPWTYIPNFLSQKHADQWLERSQNEIDWQHNDIRMFGKEIALPRLEAILGDGNYSYSGVTLKAQPWTDEFLAFKECVEKESGYSFQIAIGNQYRDGSDHIGWHSDDSPEMGDRPAIASISLGATRKFQLRHKTTKEVHSFELTHGSLFIMHPGCQEEWQHRICKASGDVRVRINWTFRPLIARDNIQPANNETALKSLTGHKFNVGDRVSLIRPIRGCDANAIWRIEGFDGGIAELILEGDPEAGKHRTPRSNLREPSSLAIRSEIIEAEIIPGRAEQLSELEAQISAGIDLCKRGEQQIWVAAYQIRSQKLFEDAGFSSFEEYCKDRWQWEKSNAHEVAGAGEVVLQLQASGVEEIPSSVAAIRPLRKLEPEQRATVIEKAAQSGRLTAQAIKQAISEVVQPRLEIPPVAAPLLPPSSDRGWQVGDWVEGRNDDGEPVQGSVAAVGVGYLRLTDGTALYEPTLLKDYPYSGDAPAEFLESSDPVNEEGIGQLVDPDELDLEQKKLLRNLKKLAEQGSNEIYKSLIRMGYTADSGLVEVSEEIEGAIAEILEAHFL